MTGYIHTSISGNPHLGVSDIHKELRMEHDPLNSGVSYTGEKALGQGPVLPSGNAHTYLVEIVLFASNSTVIVHSYVITTIETDHSPVILLLEPPFSWGFSSQPCLITRG